MPSGNRCGHWGRWVQKTGGCPRFETGHISDMVTKWLGAEKAGGSMEPDGLKSGQNMRIFREGLISCILC